MAADIHIGVDLGTLQNLNVYSFSRKKKGMGRGREFGG